MHEFAIACNLVAAATIEARRAGAVRVTALRCRIGTLRQVDDELLRQAFVAAADGTICEGAAVVIEKSPLMARCPDCGRVFAVEHWEWHCSRCRSEGDLLAGGDELELCSIDVETDDENPCRSETVAAK
jgi:hydrogenase nickel incorporation protein HypA/HybF